jgi:PKD repeat protein
MNRKLHCLAHKYLFKEFIVEAKLKYAHYSIFQRGWRGKIFMKISLRDAKKFCSILLLTLLTFPMILTFTSANFPTNASANLIPVVGDDPVNSTAVVAIDPELNTAEPTQYFTVNITVADAVNVTGWGFELWWSVPNLLDTVEANITEGPFLEEGLGPFGSTLFSTSVHALSDFYIAAACTMQGSLGTGPFDNTPVSGSGVLANATFQVIGPGTHALTFKNVRLHCYSLTTKEKWVEIPSVTNGTFYTTTPYSKFSISPDPTQVGNYGRPIVDEPVTFNASASYDPDQTYKGQSGTGIDSYQWDFGDGDGGIGSTPTWIHTYSVNDTYDVKLTVTDDDGQSYSWDRKVKINLHDIAVINVTATPVNVHPGEVVKVNATVLNKGSFTETLNVTLYANSIPVNTTFFTWYWWNDYTHSWVLKTSLLAGENGTTTILWNTTDFSGTGVYTLSVNASIISFTPPNIYESVPGLEQNLTNNVFTDGEVNIGFHDITVTDVACNCTEVDFGDIVAINVTVANEGDFTETFDVTAYYGDVAIDIQTGIGLDEGAETMLTFYWNTTYVAGGTYPIKAEATPVPNEANTTNNLYVDGDVTVWVNCPPYPLTNFTFTPENPLVGEEVTFNSTSYDIDGYITTWEWDFNRDGTVDATTENATWTYTEYGKYTVRLVVTDNESLTTGMEQTITVRAYPIANFTYSPEKPLFNQTVTFDASLSTPNGGTFVDYEWDFGDGNTTTVSASTITHEYLTFGTYTVTLTVYDSETLSNSTSKLIKVCVYPVANFTYSPSQFENPMRNEPITFNASVSSDLDGEIVSYAWNFGDNSTEVYVKNVNLTDTATHVYDEARTYKVSLNVTDNDGLLHSYSIPQVKISRAHDIAIVDVTLSSDPVFIGDTVFINVTAKNVGDALEEKTKTFNVTVYYGDTVIGNQTSTPRLAPDAEETFMFTWVTDDVNLGHSIIKAVAYTNARETSTVNNELTEAIVVVGISEFNVFPLVITSGESIMINGTVTPGNADVNVTLRYCAAGEAEWTLLATVQIDSTGFYQYTWTPSTAGTYNVVASLLEDDTVKVSSAAVTVVVKRTSTVSIDASSRSVTVGSEITINGTVDPNLAGVTVTLQYRKDDEAWSTLGTATTDSNGHYSTPWKPSDVGTYEVKASWTGDENTAGAESEVITIEVVAAQNYFIYAVAGIAIVGVIAALYYFMKLRKPK